MVPIRKRKYDAFLSYSSRDVDLARKVIDWLKRSAGLNIWFDQDYFPPGQEIVSGLLEEMDQCRGAIVLATEAAAKSDHVIVEFEHARKTRSQEPNFTLVMLTPDVTNLPIPFRVASSRYSCTPLHNGWLNLAGAVNVISAIAGLGDRPPQSHHELFVTRSEHPNEREHADAVCQEFAAEKFGLVADIIASGDWRSRIRALMSEAHGHLIVLPARPLAEQRNYLDELKIAAEMDLPPFVCAHPQAEVPDSVRRLPFFMQWDGKAATLELEQAIQRYARILKPVTAPRELFLACQYHERHERNDYLCSIIERVTSRHCRLGRQFPVYKPELTSQLIEHVRSAGLVVADAASEVDKDGHPIVNLNTCIEAGVALGASRPLIVLVRGRENVSGKTNALPFMLRNCQVLYYEDDVELVGKLFHALAPFRRRLIQV